VEYFGLKLYELNPHNFVAAKQSEFLKDLKQQLELHELIIISDFSENYSFVVQEAVQGYHWANQQWTVHSFCIYYRKDDRNEPYFQSLVMIAESIKHDITAVHLFETKLVTYLKQRLYMSEIKKIYFFSDGAAGQYKNKKNFFNICQFKEEYHIDVEWHFFGSYHWKSPCDAIGGTVKRIATRASLQRFNRNQITTAQELYDFLRQKSVELKIDVQFCSEAEYKAHDRKIRSRYAKVRTVTGTRVYHCVIPVDKFNVSLKLHSSSNKVDQFSLV
jgi:hypothetical protein